MEGQGDSCRQEAGGASGKPFANLTIDSPHFSVFPITSLFCFPDHQEVKIIATKLLPFDSSSIVYILPTLGLTLSHFVYNFIASGDERLSL